MNRIQRLLTGLVCLLHVVCVRAELATAVLRLSDAAPQSAASMCVGDGKLDLLKVRKLRNDITSPETTRGQLITLMTRLSDSAKSCADSLNSVNSTILASLHTLLADRFLGGKEYARAIDQYKAAEDLFERAGPPDVMWLRALEGKAEAEVAVGRFEEARKTAASETSLARSWAEDHAKRFMLVQALRAEARIYAGEQQPKRARELAAEAEKLESQSD